MSDQYIGEIRIFAGDFAPAGWALCNGQLLPISQNAALFSILGVSFGGNGQTTFALPDLRSRVPVHQGQGLNLSPYSVGQQVGAEQIALLPNQMPAHTHTVSASGSNGSVPTASGNFPATAAPSRGQSGAPDIYGTTASATMNPAMIASAGNGLPHANIQPSLCLTFIIALQGIYPSRG